MNQNLLLIIMSLLSILFFTFHVADDIVSGIEKGGLSNLTAIPIFVVWMYGTLMLTGRRSGYLITLLGGIFGLLVPVLHMSGKGVGLGTNIAKYAGHFFFVWTLLAIGVTALFSAILSVHGLWNLRRGKSK